MTFVEQEDRHNELDQRVRQMVRVGTVTSTTPGDGKVRVQFPDADGMISYDYPALQRKTLKDQAYSMPDVGEHVLCLCLPHGLEQGFVLGAFYSDEDTVPVGSQDKWHIKFQDGTTVEYDRGSGKMVVDCQGDVTIKTVRAVDVEAGQKVAITAPEIELVGNVTITGPLTVTGGVQVGGDVNAGGSIIDAAGNTNHHNH